MVHHHRFGWKAEGAAFHAALEPLSFFVLEVDVQGQSSHFTEAARTEFTFEGPLPRVFP